MIECIVGLILVSLILLIPGIGGIVALFSVGFRPKTVKRARDYIRKDKFMTWPELPPVVEAQYDFNGNRTNFPR